MGTPPFVDPSTTDMSSVPDAQSQVDQRPDVPPAPGPTPTATQSPTAQAVGNQPQPPVAQPQPPFWKTLLRGALEGLAGSRGATTFGGGAAAGAAGVQNQEQERFSNAMQVRFRDSQDAMNAANLTLEGKRVQQMDQQMRIQNDQNMLNLMRFNTQMNGTQYDFIPGDPASHGAALNQAMANSNGQGVHVNSGIIVTSQGSWVPRSDSDNAKLQNYQMLKTLAPAFGITAPAQQDFMSSKRPDTLMQQLNFAMKGLDPKGAQYKADNGDLDQAIASTKQMIGRAQDPTNTELQDPSVMKALNIRLSTLQAQQQAVLRSPTRAQKFGQQMQLMDARGRSMNDSRYQPYFDNSGTVQLGQNKFIASHGYSPANGQTVALAPREAQLIDIRQGADTLEQSLNKVGQVDPVAAGLINKSLQDSHGVVDAGVMNVIRANLPKDQQLAVVNYLSEDERVLSIRNLASMGVGSESQRQAVRQNVPNLIDTPTMRAQKFVNLRQLLNNIDLGTAKVAGLNGRAPVPPNGAKPAAPAAPAAAAPAAPAPTAAPAQPGQPIKGKGYTVHPL